MNLHTGKKTLLLTGALGRLGSEIINVASKEIDIIGLTHRISAGNPSAHSFEFDPATQEHRPSTLRLVRCDLSSTAEIRALISVLSGLEIRIDYLINCAADCRFLGGTTEAAFFMDEVRSQFEVNVFAPAFISSLLFHSQWKGIPVSAQQVSILNISSLSGVELFPGVGQDFYASSKAALNKLSLHMANEYGKFGIKVNALVPNSFPKLVSTSEVALAAINVLQSDAHGKIILMR